MKADDNRITVAITGASGAPYAIRLIECLIRQKQQIYLLVSSAARVVMATEHQVNLSAAPEKMQQQWVELLAKRGVEVAPKQLQVFGKEEWFSPVASGSAAPKRMIICPCSTSTLSSVALGSSNTLIERAADVVLKEQGQLIVVLRETPLSAIHLRHMLQLSELGVTVMPAAPGFYHQPQSIDDLIDFMVARMLDHLGLEQSLMQRWGYGKE
ncbi:flavin prenyltransferase UbiX [Idiomarina sp. UBA3162]|uniref:flavin prenyltransferase UbiX n=1 Tax=unclassified Idiomarina TaxID=2614829 RepID=UPI000C8F3C5B|nr:flavin prenyltransferase UbiX [Idiomarina sp. UBA3162]MAD53868.1 aromatic acid decarboxylase [Idiomarinaceae bacterium]MEC7643430.1 flavin prenyltransferase UbiX [Pseudomonadota bacterium]